MNITAQLKDRWIDWLPWAAFVVLLTTVQVVGTHFAAQDEGVTRKAVDAGSIPLLIIGPLLLPFSSRYASVVVAGVVGATLLYLGLNYAYGPVFLSPIAAFFLAVMYGHRLAGWIGAVGMFAGHIVLELLLGRDAPVNNLGEVLTFGIWFITVLIAAEVARARRERAIQAEQTREEQAQHRATAERLRIARELHDVLAHNISLISVQSGVALHLIEQKPEQARTALTAIHEASRDVLRELRNTLGVLRQEGEGAPLSPAPSLARVQDLVTRSETAGLRVSLETTGALRPLPRGVDLAAYRIIQESLTNVVRHADAANAWVTVDYKEQRLVIRIDDDGRGPGSGRRAFEGHGIQGMKERASTLGGELTTGERPGGGFSVVATLPIGDDAAGGDGGHI